MKYKVVLELVGGKVRLSEFNHQMSGGNYSIIYEPDQD